MRSILIDPTDIERLPRRVEDIYRALWDELPEPAQQALALATLAIPDGDAAWQAESGEVAAALTEFETLLADQECVLGSGHPDLQHTQDWIARLRKRLDPRKPPGASDHRKRRRRR